MPKALYRLARARGKGSPHPVRVRAGRKKQTAFQARIYLLCADCERLFDRNGEDYVMRHCYRGRGVFRLRDAVRKLTPVEPNRECEWYAASGAPEIDAEKLVYFATSVFWRAAVRDWEVEGEKFDAISLGKKYQEETRQYLLGTRSFLENAAVNIVLSKLNHPPLVFNFPVSARTEQGWCHRLHIPGITFLLTVGQRSAESALCFLRSPAHPIAISTLGDMRVQKDVLRSMGKVAPPWGEYPLIDGFESKENE